MNYTNFIGSHEWRQDSVRLAELESAGFRCRICNSGGEGVTIGAHHRTGASLVEDIAAIIRNQGKGTKCLYSAI